MGSATTAPAETFGLYLLSLTWPPSFCCGHRKKEQCSHLDGSFAATHLTIHGLWPNYTDAEAQGKKQTYPVFCGAYQSCSASLADPACLPDPATIPGDFATYGPGYVTDNHFLANHEWSKHGSCTGLDSGTYFSAAIAKLKGLPGDQGTPAVLSQNIGGKVALKALKESFGEPQSVLLSCDPSCRLQEISICFAHDEKNRPTGQIACPQNTTTSSYSNSCVLNHCDTITVQGAGQCGAATPGGSG